MQQSFVFVEDKSRKYDFVDNENATWTPKSPLVDRQKLHNSDESQLRLACKLLSERIDRGEIVPETTTTTTTKNKKTTATTDSQNADSLRHYNTASSENAEDKGTKRHSMPVISEMLRGLETGLQEGESTKHCGSETTVMPQQQQQTQQKTTRRIKQIQAANSDDDNAPQHIEEYDPLTSIPTVPDDDIVSLDRRKTSSSSSNLMRRISFSFFAFGKRKTTSHNHNSALGHYHQHNKGAVAVK